MSQIILPIILAVLGSTAVVEFIKFFVCRHDDKSNDKEELMEELKGLHKDIDGVRAYIAEDRAERAKTEILKFGDEIRRKVRHSKEHFDRILECIDTYEQYCATHPDYKNNRTVSATACIKTAYQRCLEENDFLE